ncbi:hypothetical protein WA158_007429 [Blastocystis sp. Blastoise]
MKFWTFFFMTVVLLFALAPTVRAEEEFENTVDMKQQTEDDEEFDPSQFQETDEAAEEETKQPETEAEPVYEDLDEEPIKIMSLPIHPLTDIPEPAGDVEVTYKFVDGEESFPIGEGIRCLIHLRNKGNNLYNVTNAMGSLNNVKTFSTYYQNFTEKNFNTTLYPGYEITLNYVFGIYNLMDPNNYQMALTIFYETETDSYATTFYNQTAKCVDHSNLFDVETIGMLLTFIAAIFGCLYYFTGFFSKAPTKVINPVDEHDEWIKDNLVTNNLRRSSSASSSQ